MAKWKKSEGRHSIISERECWQMHSEVSGGPGMQSCLSHYLQNIHLDGSPAISFAFSFSSQCI